MKHFYHTGLLLIFLIGCAGNVTVPQPLKEPVASTDIEKEKIDKGIYFHDQGKYDEAIKIYKEVLALNPDNVMALHEIAYSYFVFGDLKASLSYALKGLQYNSDLLGQFSFMAGNCLDDLGKPRDAIKFYTNAIKYIPDENMVYYNLGVTYFKLKHTDEAQKNFLKSLELDIHHASSHLALAKIYMQKGEQIPALLLLTRFLILEPNSQRSVETLALLENVMAAGVEKENANTININIFGLTGQNGSQFDKIEMFYKLSRATRYLKKNAGKSEFELRLGEFSSLFEFMKKDDLKESDSFLEKYLISYFSDLNKAGFGECCVYYIHQLIDDENIQQWLRQHWHEVQEFEKWNNAYEFVATKRQ